MGIVLYFLAVLIEIVSAVFRYMIGLWIGGPLLGSILAGLPLVWSFLTLLGVPSDYLTSLEMGARRPSQRERDMVEPELEALYAQRGGIRRPHTWRVIDIPEINAWVLGTTLYISRELIRSPHLRAILAHELGHINALEARLLLALRRLAFPGGLILLRLMAVGPTFIQPAQEDNSITPEGSQDAYNARLAARPLQIAGCLHAIFSWILLGVIVFSGGFSLWILTIPLMAYWRQREYEADRFAALLGEATGLAAALDYIRILDLPTPWLFFSRRAHPYSELRIDKLQKYATMQLEQIAKANAQDTEDTVLTAGSTLFFGAVGLLFFAICGLLPLLMIQPAGYETRSKGVQATAQAGLDQQVDRAGQRIGQSIQEQISSSLKEQISQGIQQGISGALAGPPTPTPLPSTAIECDKGYRATTAIQLFLKPEENAEQWGFIPRGEGTVSVCETPAPEGWIALEGTMGIGWVQSSQLEGLLQAAPGVQRRSRPGTPTPRGGAGQQPTSSAQAEATLLPTSQASKPAAQATPIINGSAPAPAGQDAQGRPVSYDFANLTDGDPATAWRSPGNSGIWLQYRYTEPVLVSSIALIPGYAKRDQASGVDRFTENRRITKARIVFANKQSIEATFRDAPEMQSVPLAQPIATTFVRIEVLETTEGSRDFTAISELVIK